MKKSTRMLGALGWVAVLASYPAGCGTESSVENTDSDDTGVGDGDADTDADSDADSDADFNGHFCEPLAPPEGKVIDVGPDEAGDLRAIVGSLETGDTVALADGTYDLNGEYLWIETPGVTLRSASGNPDRVVLDGGYTGSEIVTIAASDVTVAELTIRRAYTHGIHVTSSDAGDTLNTLIYRVHIVDSREQAIKINPHNTSGVYPDNGVVACSHLLLTDGGRPDVNPTSGGCYTGGVDAHQARGWVIRDNLIEGFWCETGLSEHAVHFWRGGRDTVVERNRLVDNARGVGFGLSTDGDARIYDDNPCPSAGDGYVCHYRGIVRNNEIFVSSPNLLASADGFDCGICLWSACGATAVHNTIVSTGDNFSAIEWRFETTQNLLIADNLTTHTLRERDGAHATEQTNLQNAPLSIFVDGIEGDLHLDGNAHAALDTGTALESGLCDFDMEGNPRPNGAAPDLGAHEYQD